MKILYLLLVGIICFGFVLIGKKSLRSSVLYTLAIGGAVNANFFYANDYPIVCFGLNFGIDSIIYTLFIFCVIIMLIKYNKKSAWTLTLSTIAAIIFSATMGLVASSAQNGINKEILFSFFNFIVSAFATLIAVYFMINIMLILSKKKLNDYAIIAIGIISATIINSVIYYGLTTLISGHLQDNFWNFFIASCIGKFIALGLSLLTYYFLQKKEFSENKNTANEKLINSN